jgi:hypothetical protein
VRVRSQGETPLELTRLPSQPLGVPLNTSGRERQTLTPKIQIQPHAQHRQAHFVSLAASWPLHLVTDRLGSPRTEEKDAADSPAAHAPTVLSRGRAG